MSGSVTKIAFRQNAADVVIFCQLQSEPKCGEQQVCTSLRLPKEVDVLILAV
jgi:hypothetical protein